MKATRVWLLAAVLASIGVGLCVYKWKVLHIPITPGSHTAVWTVEARASFEGHGKVKAQLELPAATPGFEILDENFVSRDFGLVIEETGEQRQALWSIRRATGPQTLYYRLSVNPLTNVKSRAGPFPGYPTKPDYPELYRTAIEALLSNVRAQSADIASFTRQLIHKLNTDQSDPTVALLRNESGPGGADWVRQLIHVLAGARIPARIVWGLELRHGALDARLQPWLEVHNEQQWLPFDPITGEQGYPENFLLWKAGPQPALEVDGGSLPDLRFSIRRGLKETLQLARHSDSNLVSFSLLGLPLYVQNVYTILLMVPLGAFLVVILRNLIGVKTFGTFMPVLIAMSFRETQLIWGVTLFTVLVALGLALRFVLEHLKLLLVPRLAAVLIIVILLMLGISIASYRVGFDHGLSVALFPMVILAMTIERMSIVWEEHGAYEAVIQGFGSLLVAIMAYLVMNIGQLQYMVGLFPELLLLVLAATLLMGRYTGYRLTELWRFRSVWMKP